MKLLKIILASACVLVTSTTLSMQNPTLQDLEIAANFNDTVAVKKILNLGLKPNHKLLASTVASSNPEISTLLLNAADAEDVQLSIYNIFTQAENYRDFERGTTTLQLITPYLNKRTLMRMNITTRQRLAQETQDFVAWLQTGASKKDLTREQNLAFVPVAFTLRAAHEQLKELLPLLKQNDYNKVFTNQVIRDALMTRNSVAFKILLSLIAQDRGVVNRIRDEINKLDDQKFADEIRGIIQQEVGKVPMNMSYKNVNFSFE